MAKPNTYRVTYWVGRGDYIDRYEDVRAWTAADALTQFSVAHEHVEAVREIVPVESAQADAGLRERYAKFCEWWCDEKAQSEEAREGAHELADRFRRGEVQHG